MPKTPPARGTVAWDRVDPARVVLVQGAEGLLAERAVDRIVRIARQNDPETEVTHIDASAYEPGALVQATSPSLFADACVVIVEEAASASDAFIEDALGYVGNPAPEAIVIIRHSGGNRGKKLLDAIKGAGFPVVACNVLTRDADKQEFATAEFRRAERKIDAEALRALVEAVGSNLRELAAACAQLMADTVGTVSRHSVDQYYGGRIEASGFRVADAAVAGNTAHALLLARHAMATGADPVPLVAALALKLRTLGKVGGAKGRGLDPTRDLGLASWQVDRARRDLRGWTGPALGVAIQAVAQADAEIKGAGRNPGYSIEHAVVIVAAAARGELG